MLLPPDTPRSRILWSIPAAVIIAIWTYGILAAGATSHFITYTPSQTIRAITENWQRAIWPGAYGRSTGSLLDQVACGLLQLAPLLAAVLWMLCLVPWKRQGARVTSIFTALCIPGWIALVPPDWILKCGPTAWMMIFKGGSGEEYEEQGLWTSAVALWWCMLVPLLITSILRCTPKTNICSKCGYSREGLPVAAPCPECGTDILKP